jgi:hypothetical protein
MRVACLSGRLAVGLALGCLFASTSGASVVWADQSQPCNVSQWTGTSFESFPLYKLSGPAAHFDPSALAGDGPITATVVGSSITVAINETFAGPLTETVPSLGATSREANVTAHAELTGQMVQSNPTPAGSSFTASVTGDSTLVGTGFTYSGAPLTSTDQRTASVTGTFNCAAGQLRLSSNLYFNPIHTVTLTAPGAASTIPPLARTTAKTFQGSNYNRTVLDQPLTLYRRYGGKSGEFGQFWSRTDFNSASDARRYLALPPGNPATSRVVIEVPSDETIYWGKAAPKWSEPGGGDQVVFPPRFRIPKDWITHR